MKNACIRMEKGNKQNFGRYVLFNLLIFGILVSGVSAACYNTGNFTSTNTIQYTCELDGYFENGWQTMSGWGIEKNVSQIEVVIDSSKDCETPGEIDNYTPIIYINHEYSDCYSEEEDLKKATAVHETSHISQKFKYGFTNIEDWWADASAVALEELVYDDADDYWQYLSYEMICSHDRCVEKLKKEIKECELMWCEFERGKYIEPGSECSEGCIEYKLKGYSGSNYCTPCPKGFFDDTSKSLTDSGNHRYGASLFALYLAEEHGPEIIEKSWENMVSTNQDAIEAINNTLVDNYSSTIEEEFGNFAVKNYHLYREAKSDWYEDEGTNGENKYPNVTTWKIEYEDIYFEDDGEILNRTIPVNLNNAWAAKYIEIEPLEYCKYKGGMDRWWHCDVCGERSGPTKIKVSIVEGNASDLAEAKILGIDTSCSGSYDLVDEKEKGFQSSTAEIPIEYYDCYVPGGFWDWGGWKLDYTGGTVPVALVVASGENGGSYKIKVTNNATDRKDRKYTIPLWGDVSGEPNAYQCRGYCIDGTPPGECSSNTLGHYCDNSSGIPELVPDCTKCGCPPNYDCDPESGFCVHNVTREPLDETTCDVPVTYIGTPTGIGVLTFTDIIADPPPTPPGPEPEPPPPTPTPAAVKVAVKIAAIIAAAIGGINMTEIDFTQNSIDYLSTCNTTNLSADIPYESQFVFKASNETQNSSVDAMDAFLVGLVLPNDNFWVDIYDSINIDPLLNKTEVGETFIKSDVELKRKWAKEVCYANSNVQTKWNETINNATSHDCPSDSTYYLILEGRVWIVPGIINAYGKECRLWIENATLNTKVEWYITSYEVENGPVPAECEEYLSNSVNEIVAYINETVISAINDSVNNGTEFADLRATYISLAQAQWQKNHSDSVYDSIIDSSDLSGLEITINTTQYWDEFVSIRDNNCSGMGGTNFTNIIKYINTSAGDLTTKLENLTNDAINTPYVSESNKYYFGSGFYIPNCTIIIDDIDVNATNEVDVSLSVNNSGCNKSAYAQVAYYYPNETLAYYETKPRILESGGNEINFHWLPYDALNGNYSVYVWIYTQACSPTINTTFELRADLEVTQITLNPATVEEGENIGITAEIMNNGLANASEFVVMFYFDKNETTYFPVANRTINLSAGSSVNLSVNLNESSYLYYFSAGEHVIGITADWFYDVSEYNEENNEINQTITVLPEDSVIEEEGKVLGFSEKGNKTLYLIIPKNASIANASMDSTDYELKGEGSNLTLEGEWAVIFSEIFYAKSYFSEINWTGYGNESGLLYNGYIYLNCTLPNGSTTLTRNAETGWSSEQLFTQGGEKLNCSQIIFQGLALVWNGTNYVSGVNVSYNVTIGEFPPINLSLNIGNEIWNFPGELKAEHIDMTDALNNYLANCTPDTEGNCIVPLEFHSDSSGTVEISNIDVQYYTYVGLPSPQNFTVTLADNRQDVVLNWSVVGEADGYYIYYDPNVTYILQLNESNAPTPNVTLTVSDNNSWIDTTADQSQKRFYALAAYKGTGKNFTEDRVGKYEITVYNETGVGQAMLSLPLEQKLSIEGALPSPQGYGGAFPTIYTVDDSANEAWSYAIYSGTAWLYYPGRQGPPRKHHKTHI